MVIYKEIWNKASKGWIVEDLVIINSGLTRDQSLKNLITHQEVTRIGRFQKQACKLEKWSESTFKTTWNKRTRSLGLEGGSLFLRSKSLGSNPLKMSILKTYNAKELSKLMLTRKVMKKVRRKRVCKSWTILRLLMLQAVKDQLIRGISLVNWCWLLKILVLWRRS